MKLSKFGRPLIICGMPRSGTRYCADVLNFSNEICLQGEIPSPAAQAMQVYIKSMEKYYLQAKDGRKLNWLKKRYEVMEFLFKSSTKDNIITKNGYTWFGHKTPRHERFFDFYEKVFNEEGREPYYIYCQRPAAEVWRSLKNMPWKDSENVDEFISKRNESLVNLDKIKRKASGRIYVLQLDKVRQSATDEFFNIGQWLGVDSTVIVEGIKKISVRNSSQNISGSKTQELEDFELEKLKKAYPNEKL